MIIMKQRITLLLLFFTLSLSQIGMARNAAAEAAVLKANNAIFAELEKR